jgi:hypothetical protein
MRELHPYGNPQNRVNGYYQEWHLDKAADTDARTLDINQFTHARDAAHWHGTGLGSHNPYTMYPQLYDAQSFLINGAFVACQTLKEEKRLDGALKLPQNIIGIVAPTKEIMSSAAELLKLPLELLVTQ